MVELKKALCILMAVTGVFVFTGIAGAQDNVKEVVCGTCSKCSIQNVPCGETTTTDQGKVVGKARNDCPFDYDNAYGYCPNQDEINASGNGIEKRKCRVLLNICECPDKCNLVKGTKIGIQMTVLTKGVYWAEDVNTDDGKENSTDNSTDNNTVWFYNYSSADSSAVGACQPDRDKMPRTKNFGTIKYYQKLIEKAGATGMIVRTASGPGKPAAGCLTTDVPAANRMTVIESDMDNDYVIMDTDVRDKLCTFWIDMPALRLDGNAVKGDEIKVRVSLLSQRTSPSICPDCNPPVICECVVTIGIVCCEVKANNVGCVFFPYVLQGLKDLPEDQSGGWVSGVAISARPVDATTALALPEGALCKLTLRDTEGNTAYYTPLKDEFGKGLVWAFVLDSVLPKFNKTLKPGACSLMVETNYPIDGYTFMNANMQFGAGTLPRGCYGNVAP